MEQPEDIQKVRDLIARHLELTHSPRAEWILENFSTMIPKFVKVFPHEYKRVLNLPRAEKQYRLAPPLAAVSVEVAHG
jgi:glutamate synthase (NADPH) large chain